MVGCEAAGRGTRYLSDALPEVAIHLNGSFSSEEELLEGVGVGGPGPCPQAALSSLDCPCLVCASPPFSDELLFGSALWNLGKFMEAE